RCVRAIAEKMCSPYRVASNSERAFRGTRGASYHELRKRGTKVVPGIMNRRNHEQAIRESVMRGQKRVEDARRRAGVPRIHVCGKKASRGWLGQARLTISKTRSLPPGFGST